jgi:hypothetical protein
VQAFFTTKDPKGTKERRGKRSCHAKIGKNAREKIIVRNVARGVLVFAFFARLSEQSERALEERRPRSMQKNQLQCLIKADLCSFFALFEHFVVSTPSHFTDGHGKLIYRDRYI